MTCRLYTRRSSVQFVARRNLALGLSLILRVSVTPSLVPTGADDITATARACRIQLDHQRRTPLTFTHIPTTRRSLRECVNGYNGRPPSQRSNHGSFILERDLDRGLCFRRRARCILLSVMRIPFPSLAGHVDRSCGSAPPHYRPGSAGQVAQLESRVGG